VGPGAAQLAQLAASRGAPAPLAPLGHWRITSQPWPRGCSAAPSLAGTSPSLSLDAALSSALLRMQSQQQGTPLVLPRRGPADPGAARAAGLSAALWTSQGLQRALMTEPLSLSQAEGLPRHTGRRRAPWRHTRKEGPLEAHQEKRAPWRHTLGEELWGLPPRQLRGRAPRKEGSRRPPRRLALLLQWDRPPPQQRPPVCPVCPYPPSWEAGAVGR